MLLFVAWKQFDWIVACTPAPSNSASTGEDDFHELEINWMEAFRTDDFKRSRHNNHAKGTYICANDG